MEIVPSPRWGQLGGHDLRWGEVGEDPPNPHNGAMSDPPEAPNPTSEADASAGIRASVMPIQQRGWTVRTSRGSAQGFHDLDPDPDTDTDHQIWIHSVVRTAVVFGSTQWRLVTRARRPGADPGIELCGRRSGGGLVVVQPDHVWIDAIVPAHSPLHTDDVGRAFGWLGRLWLDTLTSHLAPGSGGHGQLRLAEPSPGRRAADRPFFCFADLGHGEVLAGGNKVVGISQRRTRHWTRLQSLFVGSWIPADIDRAVHVAMGAVLDDGHGRHVLGAPPHRAAEVRAGFPDDHQLARVPAATVTADLLGRLPAVGTD